MFNRVVDWAVQNRLLVLIALAVLIATAAFQIPKLNLDAFPDVTNVQVAVNTEAPGLAAEEVEQLITYPIESVMYALPDVEEVRSISKTGLSGVTVVFKEGTDIYFARQLVFERLQAARELIPDGVGVPEMGPNSSGLGQVYQYLLIADPDSGYALALPGSDTTSNSVDGKNYPRGVYSEVPICLRSSGRSATSPPLSISRRWASARRA